MPRPVKADHGLSIGSRVQLHPALDSWMRGDRYGEVVRLTRTRVHVRLDMSGQTRGFLPQDLLPLVCYWLEA